MSTNRFSPWFGLSMMVVLACLPQTSVYAQGSNLRYAEDRAPRIVNPVFTTTMSELRMNELLFDSLFRENFELQVAPWLVEEYRFKRGSTTMDITLKQDIKWSDGTPLTAKDVAFTVNALKNKKTLSPNARYVAFIKSVKVLGDHKLQIVFTTPQTNPEQKLIFKLLPAHKFKQSYIKRTDTFKNRPVGTGPFRLVSYGDDNTITLEKNPHYYGSQSISGMTMKEIPDLTQQANLLKFESLDLVVEVLPKDVAALEKNRKVDLYPYQTNSWWFIGFNHKQADLKDKRVRQAIALASNIPELLQPIGTGDILSGPYVKASPYYNHSVQPPVQDLAKVNELLTAAGYKKVDGFWSKKGKPLSLRLYANRSLESAKEVVLNFQSQMQRAGIKVDPRFQSDSNWQQVVWRDKDFDLVMAQWTFDVKEDVYEQFHSKGSKNFISYSNSEVDKLLEKGLKATDPQQRREVYRQIHAKMAEELPYMFLWSLDSYSAISTEVENVTIHPFYYFTFIQDWVRTN